MGLSDVIGNFRPGKEFDALLVDVHAPDSPVDALPDDSTQDIIEKFLFTGKKLNLALFFIMLKMTNGYNNNTLYGVVDIIKIPFSSSQEMTGT